jgi:hypothetical protein
MRAGGTSRCGLDEGLGIAKQLLGMPGRMDRVLSTIERGELSVRTAVLEQRVGRLERSTAVRPASAIVFAAMLVAARYSTRRMHSLPRDSWERRWCRC